MSGSRSTVGVAFFTLSSRDHLPRCLPPIVGSSLSPRVLVVDSSSHDGTADEALRLGAEVCVIERSAFNHGATREMARRRLGTDIVVMMTPDAYAVDTTALGKLVAPLLEQQAAMSYGRQIPHDGAGVLEAFPRLFNYGDTSHVRDAGDTGRCGVATFFCSNAWAAYRNTDLDRIGGFVPTLRGEDHIAAAMLLRHGLRIAYVADAVVRHSHAPSLVGEVRHYFDVGYVMKERETLFAPFGRMEGRGRRYFMQLCRRVTAGSPWLLPYAVIHTAMKWAGYHVGRMSLHAPPAFKRALSSNPGYWAREEPAVNGRSGP